MPFRRCCWRRKKKSISTTTGNDNVEEEHAGSYINVNMEMAKKDEEIAHLKDQLGSLEEKLAQSEKQQEMTAQDKQLNHKRRREAVGGDKVIPEVEAKKVDKPEDTKKLLSEAILANDLLRHLNTGQVSEMIEYMEPESFPQDEYLIKEGTDGDRLYILQSGECAVTQDGRHLTVMRGGTAFGELAILYNCKRTATIRAITDVSVWSLERSVFQSVMMKRGKSHMSEWKEAK